MLTIRSPKVPNLTLVDMPGLTKIATDNQPASIVRELEEMSRAYIRPKNVIILAVSPANADIATSDAMRLVREFDPQGERTIGVLTKLDLMDSGTDAREVLEGRSLFLRHGWIGVVNRSQSDINSKADIRAARDKERAFFRAHPEYKHLRTGTDAMVSVLCLQLEKSIRAAVPQIQEHIAVATRELEAQLRALGGEMPLSDRGGRLHTVLSLCDAFDRAFEALLDGGRGGGERVRGVFESQLPAALRALPFNQIYSLRAVKDVIEVADGIQPHLIAPELGMRRLIRDGVALLRPPAESVVDAVHVILRDGVDTALSAVGTEQPSLNRFNALRATLRNTAEASLERHREETRKMVTTLVDMESAYFTAEFFRNAQAQAAAAAAAGEAADEAARLQHGPDDGPSRASALLSHAGANGGKAPPRRADGGGEFAPEVEAHLRRVSGTVSAYVASVCDSLKRSVPKAVVHCQVLQAKKSLLAPLYQQIGAITEEQLEQLLGGASPCAPATPRHAPRCERSAQSVVARELTCHRVQRTPRRCRSARRARSASPCCAKLATKSPPPQCEAVAEPHALMMSHTVHLASPQSMSRDTAR